MDPRYSFAEERSEGPTFGRVWCSWAMMTLNGAMTNNLPVRLSVSDCRLHHHQNQKPFNPLHDLPIRLIPSRSNYLESFVSLCLSVKGCVHLSVCLCQSEEQGS